MQKVLVLGSTGSIGINALSVIKNYPDLFRAWSLSGNSNIPLLEKQMSEFKPKSVYVTRYEDKQNLMKKYPNIQIYAEYNELEDFISDSNADIVISAISGFAGLLPTYFSIKCKIKKIALANKESLVCGGPILIKYAESNGTSIIPVDSEHSTLFRLLEQQNREDLLKIILTASGGPFLETGRDALKSVSISDALDHPRWKMGRKISIDSATLVNKVLEVIEAHYLFDLPYDMIDIIIHPQSIIHSLIKTRSNTYIGELGLADMKIPIANALFYPTVFENSFKDFDLHDLDQLTFKRPSKERFPVLKFLELNRNNDSMIMNIAFNASNEEAVFAFLNGEISFPDIERIIFSSLDETAGPEPQNIEDIVYYDKLFRNRARNLIKRKFNNVF